MDLEARLDAYRELGDAQGSRVRNNFLASGTVGEFFGGMLNGDWTDGNLSPPLQDRATLQPARWSSAQSQGDSDKIVVVARRRNRMGNDFGGWRLPADNPAVLTDDAVIANRNLAGGLYGVALTKSARAISTIASARGADDLMIVMPLQTKMLAHWRLGEAGPAYETARRLIAVVAKRSPLERRAFIRPNLVAHQIATSVASQLAASRFATPDVKAEAAALATARAALIRQAALRFESGILDAAILTPGVSGFAAMDVERRAQQGLPNSFLATYGGPLDNWAAADFFLTSGLNTGANAQVRPDLSSRVQPRTAAMISCLQLSADAYNAGDFATGFAAARAASELLDSSMLINLETASRDLDRAGFDLDFKSDLAPALIAFLRDVYVRQDFAPIKDMMGRVLSPSLVRELLNAIEANDGREAVAAVRPYERLLSGLVDQARSLATTPMDNPGEEVARLMRAAAWTRENTSGFVNLILSLMPDSEDVDPSMRRMIESRVTAMIRALPASLDAGAVYIAGVTNDRGRMAQAGRNIAGDYAAFLTGFSVPERRWRAAANDLGTGNLPAERLRQASATLLAESVTAVIDWFSELNGEDRLPDELKAFAKVLARSVVDNYAEPSTDPDAAFRVQAQSLRSMVPLIRQALAAGPGSDDTAIKDVVGDLIRSTASAEDTSLISGSARALISGAMQTGAILTYAAHKTQSEDYAFVDQIWQAAWTELESELAAGRREALDALPDNVLAIMANIAYDRGDEARLTRIVRLWTIRTGVRGERTADSGLDALQRSRQWEGQNSAWSWQSLISGRAAARVSSPSSATLDALAAGLDQGRQSTLSEETAVRMAVSGGSDDLKSAYEDWREAQQDLERSRSAERLVTTAVMQGISSRDGGGTRYDDSISAKDVGELRADMLQIAEDEGISLSPPPPTVAAVQAALQPRELFLAAVAFQRETLVLAIPASGPARVRFAKASTDEILGRIQDLRGDLTAETPAFDYISANALYKALFGEMEDLIEAADGVIWSPGQALDSFPLGVLPRRANAADPNWLGLSKPIMVSPTLGFFVASRTAKVGPSDGSVVAVGDIPFRKVAARGSTALGGAFRGILNPRAAGTTLDELTPTPEAKPTFDLLQSQFGARLFRGPQANADALQSLRGTTPELLVFHTHGLGATETMWSLSPAPQALALYPASGDNADGLFGADEIAALNVRARLVVLAACATSAPVEAGVEPVSGLARSFLSVGSRAVVGAAVPVSDRAAGRLTAAIATALIRQKLPPSRALMTAQLALAADPATRHPWFWSPFEVIGEGLR